MGFDVVSEDDWFPVDSGVVSEDDCGEPGGLDGLGGVAFPVTS